VKIQSINSSDRYYIEDTYTSLLKLHPHLTRFLLKTINDPVQLIRTAALRCEFNFVLFMFCRSLEFVLDTLGCSLGSYIVHLLKFIIKSYPNSVSPTFPSDSLNVSIISNSSLSQAISAANATIEKMEKVEKIEKGSEDTVIHSTMDTVSPRKEIGSKDLMKDKENVNVSEIEKSEKIDALLNEESGRLVFVFV
jgi:hypothetical protein